MRVFLGLILAASLGAACTTGQIRPLRDARVDPGEQRALVVFSIASVEELPLVRIGLVAKDRDGRVLGTREIKVDPGASAARLYAFSVPPGEIELSFARFVFRDSWWETTLPGPKVVAAARSLTYLGRVQLEEIRFQRYVDSGREYPAAVKIRLNDAREEDLAHGLSQSGAAPVKWADAGFIELAYRPIPGRSRYGTFFDWARDSQPVGPALPSPKRQNL